MENRRGNEIFLGVVGVATLVVAIIGATFAYFSASVRGDNTVNVESAKLELGFDEDTTKLTTLLIPTEESFATFAGTNLKWIAKSTEVITGYENGEDGKPDPDKPIYTTGKGLCTDDNSNIICGVYDFTVMNPNTTTMNITAEVITTVNTFEEGVMKFALYETTVDEAGNVTAIGEQIGDTLEFASLKDDGTEPIVPVDAFNFRLTAASSAVTVANKDNVESYKDVTQTESDEDGNITGKTVRTFRMVIYLEESGQDQTELNSGKMLTAALRIKTLGGEGGGVTGVIAAANVETPSAD